MLACGPSESDRLADEDNVNAAGPLLVDLEDLPHKAVLSIRTERAGVLELEAVAVDALAGRFQVGHELLCADDEDDVGGAPCEGGELASRGRGDHKHSVAGDRMDAAEREVGLAGDRLHLLQRSAAPQLRVLEKR